MKKKKNNNFGVTRNPSPQVTKMKLLPGRKNKRRKMESHFVLAYFTQIVSYIRYLVSIQLRETSRRAISFGPSAIKRTLSQLVCRISPIFLTPVVGPAN
jgi:hypothetical protein